MLESIFKWNGFDFKSILVEDAWHCWNVYVLINYLKKKMILKRRRDWCTLSLGDVSNKRKRHCYQFLFLVKHFSNRKKKTYILNDRLMTQQHHHFPLIFDLKKNTKKNNNKIWVSLCSRILAQLATLNIWKSSDCCSALKIQTAFLGCHRDRRCPL